MDRKHLKIGAALIGGVTAIAHIGIGTFDTLLPVMEADLSPMVSGTIQACWHFISMFLVYSVWVFWTGRNLRPVAFLWLGFAMSFIAIGLSFDGIAGLLIVPQWIFLGAAGGLALALDKMSDA